MFPLWLIFLVHYMDKAQFRIETCMIAYYYMITDMEITDAEKRVAPDILCSAVHTTQPC
jgi:hypothetical protein